MSQSPNLPVAREIFEHFRIEEFIAKLEGANLLYLVAGRFAGWDLSPDAISNHEMGLASAELIRKFAESSNETAGEHFTPRDIVRRTAALVFMEDDDVLTKPGFVRPIYDPTAGITSSPTVCTGQSVIVTVLSPVTS